MSSQGASAVKGQVPTGPTLPHRIGLEKRHH